MISPLRRAMLISTALTALALAGCQTRTVYVDRPVEVRVPVTVPCMDERPGPVAALIEQMPRDQWDALTTDQRAHLLAAQALERMLYGQRMTDAAAGCL